MILFVVSFSFTYTLSTLSLSLDFCSNLNVPILFCLVILICSFHFIFSFHSNKSVTTNFLFVISATNIARSYFSLDVKLYGNFGNTGMLLEKMSLKKNYKLWERRMRSKREFSFPRMSFMLRMFLINTLSRRYEQKIGNYFMARNSHRIEVLWLEQWPFHLLKLHPESNISNPLVFMYT